MARAIGYLPKNGCPEGGGINELYRGGESQKEGGLA